MTQLAQDAFDPSPFLLRVSAYDILHQHEEGRLPLWRSFDKILLEANLPHIPFHDLRHSAATILLSMGVNVKVIQELLVVCQA